MNCTTCRYELSQCLDGRLPSGRRAEVMNHAESCATCGSFWLELQAAQELTLSLRETEVSPSFREGLWERINAGEGTPSAVFHEEVPLWSKVRYALTGAAAAAAMLLGVTFLMKDDVSNPNTTNVASSDNSQNGVNENTGASGPSGVQADLASMGGSSIGGGHGTLQPRRHAQPQIEFQTPPPLMAATKRLSVDLLAVESARQLEDRYATATIGMRLMRDPASAQSAVNRIIESAAEMREFGEVLLDLHDNQSLYFKDAGVDADLRIAVKMFDKVRGIESPSVQTVEDFIAPVLSSGRLATVSNSILLKPSTNAYEQRSYLRRINTMRPDVFSKLFVVVGTPDAMNPGALFVFEDECEMGWVAPKSEINAHMQRIHVQLRGNRR